MKKIFFLPLIMTLLTANVAIAAPDVIVSSLSYANGVFTSTVKNQGTAATPSGVAIGVSYMVDGIYKTWGAVNGPLAAGASVTIGTNGGAYTIPTGTHTIMAEADDNNRFAESNETNNTLSQSTTTTTTTTTTSERIEGFAAGAGVTGGAGGQRIVVINLKESGAGSLKNAISTSGTRYITFTPGLTGTINWTGVAYVDNPNMTIDGTGANITLSGMSLNIFTENGNPADNVIVRGLTFANTTSTRNAINISYGTNDVWIDHCTFQNNSVGGVGQGINVWDIAMGGLQGITISWNHFKAPNQKALLIGSAANSNLNTGRVSVHHNWFDGVSSRNPRVYGNGMLAHAWNNYDYAWSEDGSMAISHNANFLAENNIFENTSSNYRKAIDEAAGYPTYPKANSVNASGNSLAGVSGAPTPTIGTLGTFPRAKLTYSVTPEAANNTLKQRLIQGAGAH